MSEHDHQVALFQWATLQRGRYPELAYLHAIPLGGYRHKQTALRLKAEGVKAGYPDIGLDVARCGYHGLRLELKVAPNKPSPAQLDWHLWLMAQGYLVLVCYDWVDAAQAITAYLDGTYPALAPVREFSPPLSFHRKEKPTHGSQE